MLMLMVMLIVLVMLLLLLLLIMIIIIIIVPMQQGVFRMMIRLSRHIFFELSYLRQHSPFFPLQLFVSFARLLIVCGLSLFVLTGCLLFVLLKVILVYVHALACFTHAYLLRYVGVCAIRVSQGFVLFSFIALLCYLLQS